MNTNLSAFVQGAGKLPSLPAVYHELSSAIENPHSSVESISVVLRKDQSLASRLLRLANSALYGFPSQIGSLEEAVQLIGLREIKDLLLATCVIQAFPHMPNDLVDVVSFWKHSIACGIASALLAEEQYDPASERFFVGGLLHDLGRLVLFLRAPEESREILRRSEIASELACQAEQEVLGFDHAMLGAELVTFWRLPASLCDMVGCHHYPGLSSMAMRDASIVHFADFITTALELGHGGELFVPALCLPADRRRLLEPERIKPLIIDLETKCDEIFPILAQSRVE